MKLQARGVAVRALDERPSLPIWLEPALDCWHDLGGSIVWRDVKEWAEHYGVSFGWLWVVLCGASSAVAKWQTMRSTLQSSVAKRYAKAN